MSTRRKGEEMSKCPSCSAKVRSSKLEGHLMRVHGKSQNHANALRSEVAHKGKRSEWRKAELARRRKSRVITAGACILIVVAFALAMYMMKDEGSSAGPVPVQAPPPQTETTVKIAASDLGTSAKFYSYTSSGVNIRYFAVLGADGEIHLAFDACDVCFAEKKGYEQIGDVMRCNNCGKEFAIGSIGTENLSGGCWPSYLPMDIRNGDIVVEKSDLDGKRYMFQ